MDGSEGFLKKASVVLAVFTEFYETLDTVTDLEDAIIEHRLGTHWRIHFIVTRKLFDSFEGEIHQYDLNYDYLFKYVEKYKVYLMVKKDDKNTPRI